MLTRQEVGLRTPGVPSWIDDGGKGRIAQCLVGDKRIWDLAARLELEVSELVCLVFSHGRSGHKEVVVFGLLFLQSV
jgi:hypothetical protein